MYQMCISFTSTNNQKYLAKLVLGCEHVRRFRQQIVLVVGDRIRFGVRVGSGHYRTGAVCLAVHVQICALQITG